MVVFILLLALVLGRGKSKERVYEEQQAQKEELVFADFNPESVSHITLSSLQNGVIDFKKIAGYWMVAEGGQHEIIEKAAEEAAEESVEGDETDESPDDTNGEETAGDEEIAPVEEPGVELRYYRADENQVVDGILASINNMEKGIVVSHDRSKHTSEFQVGRVLGIEVQVEDINGSLLAHFYIGKEADMLSNYIRFNDEDEVYEIKQALRNLTGKPFTAWRDRTMFQFAPEIIDRVQFIDSDGEVIEFAKDPENNWVNEALDWSFDGPLIDTAIQRMSGLSATDFASPHVMPEEMGLDDSAERVVVEGAGESYELIIGEMGDAGKIYCTTGHDDSKFMVSQPDIDIVLLGRDKLELEEPPASEEEEPVE